MKTAPPAIQYGSVLNSFEYLNSVITYVCQENHTMIGTATLACEAPGLWDVSLVTGMSQVLQEKRTFKGGMCMWNVGAVTNVKHSTLQSCLSSQIYYFYHVFVLSFVNFVITCTVILFQLLIMFNELRFFSLSSFLHSVRRYT